MNFSVLVEVKATTVKITNKDLFVTLADGREIRVPLIWFPKLFRAPLSQKKKYRFIGNGIGIHWPELDEDLSIAGLLKS